MVLKHKIYLELLTPRSLTSREDGNQVLRLWERYLPTCLPEKVGNWEPINHAFDLNNLDAALNLWRWPFFAKRKKPRMEAQIFMRRGAMPQHATWVLNFDCGETNVDELAGFLKEAAKILNADFGCLTLLNEAEIEAGRHNGTVTALDKKSTRFNFFIASQDLQTSIPDVYWLTVFGPPYVKRFGKDKLLSAPATKVEELGDTAVLVQLTSRLEDMRTDVATFNAAKAELKSFLGQTAFSSTKRRTHSDE